MEFPEPQPPRDYETYFNFLVKGQRRFRIRMGSNDVSTAAAGDAASTSDIISQKLRKSETVEKNGDHTRRKYSRRKKKITKRCPLLTLSNQTSESIIAEALHDNSPRIENGILDVNESGNESTNTKLNACGFPYYRSWCSGHCRDAVLVKDACVSCTALASNHETCESPKSKSTTLERNLLSQLKTEYRDLSAITRKISAYTKDIIVNISTKAGMKSSTRENTDENASSHRDSATLPMAMQYYDKSGRPCLKLRLRDSIDSPSYHRERQEVSNRRFANKETMRRIFTNKLGSINETSSTCSSSSIYNYLMFTRRSTSTKNDSR